MFNLKAERERRKKERLELVNSKQGVACTVYTSKFSCDCLKCYDEAELANELV